ncbi:hypothetical protein Sru01_34040 [Sphaerisporangium rufum]|uniref:Uncharacterized protein n=1 Tax=Sphaerisporangium rufum TaxID=1381558 RepID=A0A919R2E8_9ACTN|nr:hypothetical protein Sru01_34040 [Sphaerisporangium rufum]
MTTVRLTPSSRASSRLEGSRSPGAGTPRRALSRSRSPSCTASGTGEARSRTIGGSARPGTPDAPGGRVGRGGPGDESGKVVSVKYR